MIQAAGAELIKHYFPEITSEQFLKFDTLFAVYEDWNAKINVISRKDFAELYIHHVLHSLAIARFIQFQPGSKIFDLGSGGGFPGIPLAIMFPDSSFMLCDSISKKMRVAKAVAESLHLKNIHVFSGRAETVSETFDFVVSRAVAEFPQIRTLTKHLLRKQSKNSVPNGWICLKGGNLNQETHGLRNFKELDISRWFDEPFFLTKKVLYIPYQ
jgi:16S rRNA (guanine527-N7)-methyltransferase